VWVPESTHESISLLRFARKKRRMRCFDLPRDHDDIVLLLLRLCRQTTTMYGRPEEFASSCFWAFFRDNSIIPTRCGRLIFKGFALKSFSGRFRLFLFYDSLKRENFWRSRRLYHTVAIDISSLCGKKTWLTRVAHGRDHFKFLPRSVDFKSVRPPKVERWEWRRVSF